MENVTSGALIERSVERKHSVDPADLIRIFDPGTAVVTFVTVPPAAHSSWWPLLSEYLDTVRESGGTVVAEGDPLTANMHERRLARIQARLSRHADKVAATLAPHGWVDSSRANLYCPERDVVVGSAVVRLNSWRWWHLFLELPVHRLFLIFSRTRIRGLGWEWLDNDEIEAGTRAVRADALNEAARRGKGPVVVLVSPMLAAYLGVMESNDRGFAINTVALRS